MAYTEQATEHQEMIAVIHPDLHGPGEYYTPWYDHGGAHKSAWWLKVGDITATGIVDLELTQATDANGTGEKVIAGKAIAQLTQAGGDGDEVCVILLRTEQLDVQNGFAFVRAHLEIATASANADLIALTSSPRYRPVSITGITEIVP